MNSASKKNLIVLFWIIIFGSAIYLYPHQPLKVNSLVVQEAQVPAAGTMTLKLDYCKGDFYANTAASVKYTFQNSLSYEVPTATSDVKLTGCHVATIRIIAPEELPTGSYKLIRQTTYHFRFLNDVMIPADSNVFAIVHPEQSNPLGHEIARVISANTVLVDANRRLVWQNAELLKRIDILLQPHRARF